jgi:flagellar secretion chaperone FliS
MTVNNALKAYTTVGVETSVGTADSHKLISMLFQGALLAIANARNAMLRKDIPVKGKSITQAIRIIGEGLQASLDKNVGGKLTQDLDALYDYMSLRLVEANLKNDSAILDEVAGLLNEIKDAWDSIRPANSAALPVAQPQPATANKQSALVYGRG